MKMMIHFLILVRRVNLARMKFRVLERVKREVKKTLIVQTRQIAPNSKVAKYLYGIVIAILVCGRSCFFRFTDVTDCLGKHKDV